MASQELITNLQKNPKKIRNLCILAHVDHGKTTLADMLLSSNGIISNRMAGKLRYMDSLKAEQERGITMKSSAVTLIHEYEKNDLYLINLIDSPGHVDFSTEVTTAVRLCDAAIIVIDVCEGICPQTHAVLRQASIESLKLIVVLNKIDRLIIGLKMQPHEAYMHLNQILEQLNAIVAQQYASLLFERSNNVENISSSLAEENLTNDIDESKLYFSPSHNNVIYASALDGFGFSVKTFANIYAAKLGINKDILTKTLWGDYYYNSKTKRVMKGAQNQGKKPLFVQLVLDNIWTIYDALFLKKDNQMMEKIITSLNIKIPPRDLKSTEPKAALQSLFNSWIPLSKAVLDMAVEYLPSPLELTEEKVEHLMCSKSNNFKCLPIQSQNLKEDFLKCQSNASQPVIVYISKMFAAEKASICKNKRKQLTLEEIAQRRELIRQRKLEIQNNPDTPIVSIDAGQEIEKNESEIVNEVDKFEFLAFARVFSGTLKRGQTLFILSPRHNPQDFIGKDISIDTPLEDIQKISKHVTKFTVNEIYLMMGREFQILDEAPSGNILAIGGLEGLVIKSATLSNTIYCPSFSDMYMQVTPIVRVAIEPKHPSNIKKLIEGLRLLNQSDPSVEIKVQQNGEHILCTAGEVHLQRCIEDLVNELAKVEVNVSPPRIPFRETIVVPPKYDYVKEKIKVEQSKEAIHHDGLIEIYSNDKKRFLAVIAKPLPNAVIQLLENNQQLIKSLNQLNENIIMLNESLFNNLKEFKKKLQTEFDAVNANNEWTDVVDKIWSFGPNRTGSNLLINNVAAYQRTSIWSLIDYKNYTDAVNNINKVKFYRFKEDNSIVLGFQLMTSKGPLCEEPLMGVCFSVEKCQFEDNEVDRVTSDFASVDIEDSDVKSVRSEETIDVLDVDDFSRQQDKLAKKTLNIFVLNKNQTLQMMKEACKKAFEAQPQRLMAAMYKCQILSSAEALGKVYAVLGKRDGRVLDEQLKDGTSIFIINALLPVSESFGFAEELRKKTGGLASPHLEFSHFETIDMDPFWEPKTEEEYLLYGDKADFDNKALKYVNEIRKRKGLFTKEKIVAFAEKQRTLIKD